MFIHITHSVYTETYDTEGQLRQALAEGAKFALEFADNKIANAGIIYLTDTIENARLIFKKYRDYYSMADVREYKSDDLNDYKSLFSGWL
jgi:hypothetical protein